MTISIVKLTADYMPGVLDVVEALPAWFNEEARKKEIPTDLRFHDGFIALDNKRVVGFILMVVNGGRMHISWMGVHPEFHRQGIGGLLIRAAEAFTRSVGICELEVFTLGDTVDYEPYEATRAFYRDQGFSIYLRAQTDNLGCPEEIRLKKQIC